MDLNAIADEDKRTFLMAVAGRCCVASNKFNWYDSNFLRLFEAAKQFLQIVRPERLEEFVAGFAILRTDPDYRVRQLDAVFDEDLFRQVVETVHTLPYVSLEHYETGSFGRSLLRRHPFFVELQAALTARVGELVGEPVTPSYNFLSLYRGSGKCEPHLDEPEAKWTLDICIEQSTEWPIFISQVVDWPTEAAGEATIDGLRSNPALKFDPIVLTPNRGAIFSGSSQWHFREPMAGGRSDYCHLLFFHYLPAGAEPVADPKRWAAHFGIPELDILIAADELAVGKPTDI